MRNKDLEKRDCKPGNYNFISSNLKYNKAFLGKEDILFSLEQLLLKTMLVPSPEEKQCSLSLVRTFDGKKRMITTFWFSELRKSKALANLLMRICRVRYN